MMLLNRRYRFSGAHRLWNDALSDEDNLRLFGKCTRYHGHNYTLDVVLTGPQDPLTGMILNLTTLDALVQAHLLDAVDHYDLDREVPFLSGQLSTVENLTLAFFHRLAPQIPAPARLHRIRVAESETNWAEYCADEETQP